MTPFRAYLWKEWREQRALLLALAASLALVTGVVGLLLDWKTVVPGFTYDWVVSLCVAGALVSVGADLFGRERQRVRLQFLERLPAGLGTAFRAKLAFFGLLLAAAVGYGLLLAALAELVFTGKLDAPEFSAAKAILAALALVAAAWVFAVSTWTPTSAVVVPLTAILLALCLLPGWLLMPGDLDAMPDSSVFWVSAACASLGGLGYAWISFAFARARGRRTPIAVGCGLLFTLLSFTPYTAWAGVQRAEWNSWPARITDVVVGAEARYAFLSLERFDPEKRGKYGSERGDAIVLAIEDGGWKLGGEPNSAAFGHVPTTDSMALTEPVQEVALFDPEDGELEGLFDASTGRPRPERHATLTASRPFSPRISD